MSFDISMCESIFMVCMLKKVTEALNMKLNKIKPYRREPDPSGTQSLSVA